MYTSRAKPTCSWKTVGKLQNGYPNSSFRSLGGLLGLLRPLGDLLESFWELWIALSDLLGRSWSLLGRSRQLLGWSWELSGPPWERLGRLLESFWSPVGVLLRSEAPWKAVWKSFLQILQNPQKHWKVLQIWRSRGAGIDEK